MLSPAVVCIIFSLMNPRSNHVIICYTTVLYVFKKHRIWFIIAKHILIKCNCLRFDPLWNFVNVLSTVLLWREMSQPDLSMFTLMWQKYSLSRRVCWVVVEWGFVIRRLLKNIWLNIEPSHFSWSLTCFYYPECLMLKLDQVANSGVLYLRKSY